METLDFAEALRAEGLLKEGEEVPRHSLVSEDLDLWLIEDQDFLKKLTRPVIRPITNSQE